MSRTPATATETYPDTTPCDAPAATDGAHGRPTTRRSPLTAAQQALALKYVPMAKSLAKPLKLSWPLEGEEFDSAALLALVEAAQSFDPTRNVKFSTFARYRIWGALRDVQRGLITSGWRGDLENAPSVASLAYDAEEHGRVLNAEPDAPVGEDLESLEYVEHFLRKLPARHATACRIIYVDGKTQSEAAAHVGCSKSRLSYLHKEALRMINDAWRYEARAEEKGRFKKDNNRPDGLR